LFVGLGLAGENFGTLPYDRSFYGGGVNGLRGWATRGLGPGATGYAAPTEVIKGLGDLRLELNAEFRQPITSVLQLAWFTDAGNVWLTGNAPDEATWSRGGRWESLAWNTGMGLRLDFDFFLLRLDAGLRLHDPGLSSGERWVGQHPARGAVHLGIGHPF
jgi:outer membrane protein assembly factor BamA